jgi:hypothetical protein
VLNRVNLMTFVIILGTTIAMMPKMATTIIISISVNPR